MTEVGSKSFDSLGPPSLHFVERWCGCLPASYPTGKTKNERNEAEILQNLNFTVCG